MKAWKEDRITHRQALREMGSLRAGLAESGMAEPAERASILPKPETLHVNDMVMHTVFRKKGRVTEVDEKHKRVRLDLGGVGLWADMKDIRKPRRRRRKRAGRPRSSAASLRPPRRRIPPAGTRNLPRPDRVQPTRREPHSASMCAACARKRPSPKSRPASTKPTSRNFLRWKSCTDAARAPCAGPFRTGSAHARRLPPTARLLPIAAVTA